MLNLSVATPSSVPDEVREIADRLVQRRGELAIAVPDIAHLLSVSQANVAAVRDQPWYKRAWATITGSNRRLAERNEANLLDVQRLALSVLTVLPEMDEHAARSIALLQYQIRVLTYSDHDTKHLLEELVNRCAMRFADHERRILNIEVDTRVLQWVHSRYDKIESARYDEMPVAKRVLLMTDRFMDLTAFRWDEQAVHALLNAMETASVHLDEKWALRRFGTRLYEEWLVFLDPSQSPGLLTLAIPDGGMVDLAPVHAVVSEALRFRSTGYGSEHLDAAFERLLSIGIELDEEVSVGDLARTLLEEGRLAAMARAGGAPRHQGGRVALPSPRSKGPRKEYWHQRTEPNDIQEATHHRAQELLAKKDDDLPYLLSLLDLYAAAGEEIEGRKLDLTLLVRMVKVSLTLSSASIPGDQFVEHAKRLFQYGRTQMAYEWHAQLVEAAPDHAELRNNLGFLLLYRGNVLDAQRELERATALGFDGGVHWINKGVVSVLLEKLEDAEQHLRKAAKQSSESVAAELVLLCGGATESDATASRVVLTAGSMKAIALCNLGLVLHRRKTDGAGKCFDDAVREEKKLSFALRAAGWFFHSVEQHRRAADHFRRARKLEPRHPMNDWENEQLPCYYFFKGGRNETCCCGSGKKFKHCCEAMMA